MAKQTLIIFFSFFLMNVTPVLAQTDALDSVKYQECLSLIQKDNESAISLARKWYVEGGNVAAQHCEALALYELNNYNEAAQLFDMIVDKLVRGEGVGKFAFKNRELLKIQLYYLSGLAWHSAGELDKAYQSLSASIIDLPVNSTFAYDIYLERAHVQVERDDAENAIEDYTRALDLNSEKIDGFLYRARAFRKLQQHLKARLDLNAALTIEPRHPDLLFESAINYRMLRENKKALLEWNKIIDAYPDSHWQQLAQQNINLMDQ